MNFTEREFERDLEDFLFNSDNRLLFQRGLDINGIKRRNIDLLGLGVIDIVTADRTIFGLEITIYELKQGDIDMDALLQLAAYITRVKRYLDNRNIECNVNGVIIGRKVKIYTDCGLLFNFFHTISFYTYSYNSDGLQFKYSKDEECKGSADFLYDDIDES